MTARIYTLFTIQISITRMEPYRIVGRVRKIFGAIHLYPRKLYTIKGSLHYFPTPPVAGRQRGKKKEIKEHNQAGTNMPKTLTPYFSSLLFADPFLVLATYTYTVRMWILILKLLSSLYTATIPTDIFFLAFSSFPSLPPLSSAVSTHSRRKNLTLLKLF